MLINGGVEFVDSQVLNFGVKKGRNSGKIIRYIADWKERGGRVRKQYKGGRLLGASCLLRSDKISIA